MYKLHHDLNYQVFLGNIFTEQRVTIAMNLLSCDNGLFVTGLYFSSAIPCYIDNCINGCENRDWIKNLANLTLAFA